MGGRRALSVGFDVSPLSAPRTGIGRYTSELLAALAALPSDEVVAVGNRKLADSWRPAGPGADVLRGLNVRGPRFPSRTIWTFGLLPVWLRRSPLDLFHATSYYAPFGAGMPVVVTVHDLSVLACPEHHPRARVLRARLLLPDVARHAAAVITPTDWVRREAVRLLGLPADRVHVVPEAASSVFRRTPTASELDAVAARYDLERGFFLAVGTLEPRKNLRRVVDAVARLRREGRFVRLVVAGGRGWKFRPLLEDVQRLGLTEQVRFVGFVPDADLRALMGLAAALVYPSTYEGFGLPILEAMAAGLPVVTSNAGGTAEVAGEAALLVDPLDVEAIAAAMERVLDPVTSAGLRRLGTARARQFSWEETARGTAAAYRTVVEARRIAA